MSLEFMHLISMIFVSVSSENAASHKTISYLLPQEQAVLYPSSMALLSVLGQLRKSLVS